MYDYHFVDKTKDYFFSTLWKMIDGFCNIKFLYRMVFLDLIRCDYIDNLDLGKGTIQKSSSFYY